ncbi:MAG: hypothetical protein AAB408_04525 [Patescibacteria group bacterium]
MFTVIVNEVFSLYTKKPCWARYFWHSHAHEDCWIFPGSSQPVGLGLHLWFHRPRQEEVEYVVECRDITGSEALYTRRALVTIHDVSKEGLFLLPSFKVLPELHEREATTFQSVHVFLLFETKNSR